MPYFGGGIGQVGDHQSKNSALGAPHGSPSWFANFLPVSDLFVKSLRFRTALFSYNSLERLRRPMAQLRRDRESQEACRGSIITLRRTWLD